MKNKKINSNKQKDSKVQKKEESIWNEKTNQILKEMKKKLKYLDGLKKVFWKHSTEYLSKISDWMVALEDIEFERIAKLKKVMHSFGYIQRELGLDNSRLLGPFQERTDNISPQESILNLMTNLYKQYGPPSQIHITWDFPISLEELNSYNKWQTKIQKILLDEELRTSQEIYSGSMLPDDEKIFKNISEKKTTTNEKISTLNIGDKVLAESPFKAGDRERKYQGEVENINPNGTYCIRFIDGSVRETTPRKEIILDQKSITFSPGKIGISYAGYTIHKVIQSSQADLAGVKTGWRILSVNSYVIPNDTSKIYLAISKTSKAQKDTKIMFYHIMDCYDDEHDDEEDEDAAGRGLTDFVRGKVSKKKKKVSKRWI